MDQHEALVKLCRENYDAVRLIEGAWLLSCVYDDAIDGQKKRTDAEIHQAFAFALFELHTNRVVQQFPHLKASLMEAVACWRAANELERLNDREKLHAAFTLRCSPYQFFIAVVLAVAGVEAAVEAATYFYGEHTEDTLDSYLAEHLKG